jgi:thiol:disulfide interchange protein DsbC
MKLTSLKSLKLARPRLGQVLMPIAAITLGSGGSLVWANSAAGEGRNCAACAERGGSGSDRCSSSACRAPRSPASTARWSTAFAK